MVQAVIEKQADAGGEREAVLSVRDLTVGFGDHVVLDNLNLEVLRGEILGFVGASGTGKSVLMRTVLRLLPKRSGTIEILGADYDSMARPSASHSICARRAVPAWRAFLRPDGA